MYRSSMFCVPYFYVKRNNRLIGFYQPSNKLGVFSHLFFRGSIQFKKRYKK